MTNDGFIEKAIEWSGMINYILKDMNTITTPDGDPIQISDDDKCVIASNFNALLAKVDKAHKQSNKPLIIMPDTNIIEGV